MNKNAYDTQDLLRIARRVNNTRRKYLLVNPLQAKHMPVSPSMAYNMMYALGEKIKTICGAKDKLLIIGFAETATAIGAVVARCLGRESAYIHTTREMVSECKSYYNFLEEHSHAIDQRLCADNFHELLSGIDAIVLVEDEISTGKTIFNMIQELVFKVPEIKGIPFIAASIINRMSKSHQEQFHLQGIRMVSLLSIDHDSYEEQVEAVKTVPAVHCPPIQESESPYVAFINGRLDPRRGVHIGTYHQACITLAEKMISTDMFTPTPGKKVLVLGTEECMYPALIVGRFLEQAYPDITVKCHATTRSPIAVSRDCGYPITEGYSLISFYDSTRNTFIYNLDYYDSVFLITDARELPKTTLFNPAPEATWPDLATKSIIQALGTHGYGSLSCIRWETVEEK